MAENSLHTIFFISLGCDKNLVDSEIMIGLLRQACFELVTDESEAEVIVVNTCSFVCDARDESIQTLIEMGRMKEEGRCRVLIAAGCLAERYKDEILTEMPEVDGVVGTASYQHIAELVKQTLGGRREEVFEDVNGLPQPDVDRAVQTGSCSSYLKIAEGCDKHCSYCIIPSLRGHYRSYPMDYLVRQARKLAEQGIRELNLVAQETTVYGTDIYGKKMLPELLRRLCRIDGLEWIRILYCYPEEITQELLETIRDEDKICDYLDLPIQHASDRILKLMGRRTNHDDLVSIIRKAREIVPDICLRTTLISGFPTETEEDHQILKDFVREQKFDRLGVFCYSREDGTRAALMEGQIDEAVKERRRGELMEIQQDIVFEKNRSMEGRQLEVLLEGRIPEDDVYVGRTRRDAPDVDGYIFLDYDGSLMSGDIVPALVTGARDYDLTGDVMDEFTE